MVLRALPKANLISETAVFNGFILYVDQLFAVNHVTMAFDGEWKIFRSRGAPFFESASLNNRM